LTAEIRKHLPGFEIEYKVDPGRQAIADSWPRCMDDTAARREWGWEPQYTLPYVIDDMLDKLRRKLLAHREAGAMQGGS
jgi:nucleoside-diphosphate-sugar epimerase